MKPTALLLAVLTLPALNPAALAQTLPAQTTPDPAPVTVPALPPATPEAPAPPSPPDLPTAEPAVPAPEVLRLTARPGTYAEYATSLQVKFQLLDMHFEAQPGKTVKAADLAALNARAKAQGSDLNVTMNKSALSQTGKSFVRVQPPVNGDSVVLTTTILSLPDALHPGKTRPVSVGTTLTYDPGGKIVGAVMTSNDPQVQKVYQALDMNTMIENAQQVGSSSLYGQPLVLGQRTTLDTALDGQRLLQSVLGTAGTAAQKVQVQARPMTLHVTTAYTGRDARGQLTFSQTLSMEPWNVSMQMDGLDVRVVATGLTGGGTSAVRPDGLTQTSTFNQTMTMQMQMDMPGEPYRMVMKVQYGVSTATTLKKISLP